MSKGRFIISVLAIILMSAWASTASAQQNQQQQQKKKYTATRAIVAVYASPCSFNPGANTPVAWPSSTNVAHSLSVKKCLARSLSFSATYPA